MANTRKTKSIFRFTLRLRDCEPPIWRTILVRGSATLHQLHMAIQRAMGWTNSHLYQFEIGDDRYTDLKTVEPFDEDDVSLDARTTRLSSLGLVPGKGFTYLYDFGDHWLHDVTVDAIEAPEAGTSYPRCVAGARACPPEDCGGVPGYFELLEALSDPGHPEHKRLRVWVGNEFDTEAFELDAVNRRMGRPKGGARQ